MISKSVMIVGVGGQGTLLASKILGAAMIEEGYDVKVSEVHGMSQRGGSVVTYVKAGDEVASPIITKGEADIIISFEQLEAARWLPYLKKGGKMIINSQKIDPMPVVIGTTEYPDDVIEHIKATGADITVIDALPIAEKAGSAKAVNIVLLGVAAKNTGIGYEIFQKAVRDNVPEKFTELNLKALEMGYNYR